MDVINSWDCDQFIEHLGNLVEKCPLAAATVWGGRPFNSVNHLASCFTHFLTHHLSPEGQEGVLRLHPELGNKAQITDDDKGNWGHSKREQSNAGLTDLDVNHAETLMHLNARYKELSGFPFVVCVAELPSGVKGILKALRERLTPLEKAAKDSCAQALHTARTWEREEAIRHVTAIVARRLEELIDSLTEEEQFIEN